MTAFCPSPFGGPSTRTVYVKSHYFIIATTGPPFRGARACPVRQHANTQLPQTPRRGAFSPLPRLVQTLSARDPTLISGIRRVASSGSHQASLATSYLRIWASCGRVASVAVDRSRDPQRSIGISRFWPFGRRGLCWWPRKHRHRKGRPSSLDRDTQPLERPKSHLLPTFQRAKRGSPAAHPQAGQHVSILSRKAKVISTIQPSQPMGTQCNRRMKNLDLNHQLFVPSSSTGN